MIGNSFVINAHLRKLSYDPLTDFKPICHLVNSPQSVTVNSNSPYKSLTELFTAAKAKPRELTIATVGPATAQHIAVETLKRTAGADMTYVPYPGDPQAINALLGGHVTTVLGNYSVALEHVKSGKLRALALAEPQRLSSSPDIPTVVESGYRNYTAVGWFAVVAPGKTQMDKATQLAEWFTAAMQAPSVVGKLGSIGVPVGTCGESFGAYLRGQSGEYERAIREANIKAE